MPARKGDHVVLTNAYPGMPTRNHPIWGSKTGYISGVIKKIRNHDHNPNTHEADVDFHGVESTVKLKYLRAASGYELGVSNDFVQGSGYGSDLMILGFQSGSYLMALAHPLPCEKGDREEFMFEVFATKSRVKNTWQSDYNLLLEHLSNPLMTRFKTRSLVSAVRCVCNLWGLPQVAVVDIPTEVSPSLQEVFTCKPVGVRHALAVIRLESSVADLAFDEIITQAPPDQINTQNDLPDPTVAIS